MGEKVRQLPRCGAPLGRLVVAVCLGALPLMSAAQSAGEPAPASDTAALERAKRDADKVFKWIMIHSDKPRRSAATSASADAKATAPQAPPAPATATVAAVPRAAAKAKVEDSGIVERVIPLTTAVAAQAPRPQIAPLAAAPAASVAAVPAQLGASDAAFALATASAAAGRTMPLPGAPEPEDEDEDQPLVLVKQVEPEFSTNVMRKLLKGAVQVRFEVKPDGEVGQTEVVKTSSARLNDAAMRAVAQWKFHPLKKAQHGIVELAFNLEP
jgi:TonB family protein